MTSIDNAFASLGRARPAGNTESGKLGQEEYLTLMMAQFQNQDPFKPMESGDFLGEIAQFGTVSGIADLQSSFSQFAASLTSDQTLQASGLIERRVLVATDFAHLADTGTQAGVVDLPHASSGVTVDVTDASGALVRRLSFGAHPGGPLRFDWDGNDALGVRAPAGDYRFTAQSVGPGGAQAADVLLAGTVQSVSLSPTTGLLTLNFDSLDPQALSAVREIS